MTNDFSCLFLIFTALVWLVWTHFCSLVVSFGTTPSAKDIYIFLIKFSFVLILLCFIYFINNQCIRNLHQKNNNKHKKHRRQISYIFWKSGRIIFCINNLLVIQLSVKFNWSHNNKIPCNSIYYYNNQSRWIILNPSRLQLCTFLFA